MLERELRLLIEEHAVKEVIVIRQAAGGYVVQLNGRTLKSARREIRRFARLDTVADLLHKFGIDRFVVARGDKQSAIAGIPDATVTPALTNT